MALRVPRLYEEYQAEIIDTMLIMEYGTTEAVTMHPLRVTNPERQIRPIKVFPGRKDITYFTVDLEGSIYELR